MKYSQWISSTDTCFFLLFNIQISTSNLNTKVCIQEIKKTHKKSFEFPNLPFSGLSCIQGFTTAHRHFCDVVVLF